MKVMLDEGAKIPTKAHISDAGWDLYAKEDFTVPACSYKKCIDQNGLITGEVCAGSAIHDTGVHIEIPEGYVGFLKSKSGLNVKHGLISDGTIDAGYTGSIIVKLYNLSENPHYFTKGDKITQLVVLPINTDSLERVESLNETERGDAGFGSSGK